MNLRVPPITSRSAGFTMVEIAICLAVIGLALVAIIGVLPLGMKVQRDNREETVINQDASVLIESLRSGARGGSDLTNYVYAITNNWVLYDGAMKPINQGTNGYQFGVQPTFLGSPPMFTYPGVDIELTNNLSIIGLLSTPEFVTAAPYFCPTNNLMNGGYSNHVVAYVRALSGPAVEKPPQDNAILISDSFTYRLRVINAPFPIDTNFFNTTNFPGSYNAELAANSHELSLTFYWPLEPNGSVGTGRQTQRAMVAGTVVQTNSYYGNEPLYFYQSQSFTKFP